MTHRFLSTTFLTGALCALPHLASAQVWDEAPEPDGPVNAVITFDWARKVTTDMVALEAVLDTAPPESSGTSNVKIDLPLPDGGVGSFMLMNSPIMETELAAQEFGIETYTVMDQDNPNNVGRLDMTSRGFQRVVLTKQRSVKINNLRLFPLKILLTLRKARKYHLAQTLDNIAWP